MLLVVLVALVVTGGVAVVTWWWVRSMTKGLGPTPTLEDMNRGLHLANVMNARKVERDDLRVRGVSTKVEVIEYKDTGEQWAMTPLYQLRVRIFEGPHSGHYVNVLEAVPFVRVSVLSQGAELSAWLDPANPDRLAIDW